MSDHNLAIKITADIADLQSKFILAKAEVTGLTTEMNKLAKASSAGSLSIVPGAFQQMAGDLVAAKQQAAGLAGELEKAGVSVSTFGQKMGEGHGSISTATREFRALFDELSSGRTRQTPGTLAIIAQRVIGLGPAALGATAGVLGLVGGIGYLVVKSIEASNALARMSISAATAGNFSLTTEKLKELTQQLELSSHISGSAGAIAADLATIPNIAGPALDATTALMGRFVGAFGIEADKAGAEIKKLLEPDVSASKVADDLAKLGATMSQAQRDAAQAADRTGDANVILAGKIQLVNEVSSQSRQLQVELDSARTSSFTNSLAYQAEEMQGIDAARDMLLQQTQAWNANSAAINANVTALRAQQQNPEQALQGGLKIAKGENPMALQVQEAKDKVQELTADLNRVKDTASQANISLLNAGLDKAKENLSNLQFGPVLERMREQMAQVAATWDGTQSGMLAKQIQVAQGTLASVQQNSKERAEIETEVAHLEVQQRQAVGAQLIAEAKAQVAAINGETAIGAVQRSALVEAEWVKVLQSDRATAAQRLEAAREFNTAYAAIQKETSAQVQAIARSDADTDIAIARLTLDAKRSALEQEVQANQMAASQKLAILRELSAQEFALNDKALENELKSLQEGTPEYERAYNQIRELKAKLVIDLTNLDGQYAKDLARQLKEQNTLWSSSVKEIENVEGTLVSDVLNRRKSMSQSLQQIGAELVTKEISNDLKAFTTKMLLNNQEEALKQGGLLFHMLTEQKKVASTVTSEAQQTSAQAAGDAARLVSQSSAAAAGQAAQAAIDRPQIQKDAAKAAAGAYAALAGIPIVGPILAPIAAGVAYAGVTAFESFDVGTNYVPRNMLAQIHEGEAVVPKAYNPAAGGQSGGAGAGGAGGGDTHNYGGNNISVGSNDIKRMLSGRGAQRVLMDTLAGAYRRGAR